MDEERHSVVINICKRGYLKEETNFREKHFIGRISKKEHSRIIQKPSENTLKAYAISDDKPLPVFQLKNDYSLLSYKFYSKLLDRQTHRKRLAIPLYDKHKIISTDLRQRLHVDYSSEKITSILDFDEDFYNCINGRSFKHAKIQYKSFKTYLNKQLRMQQEVGQIMDCILNIDEKQKMELKVYNETLSKLTEQAKFFDDFISEDYQKSMVLLDKGDTLLSDVDKINSELEYLASEKFFIMSKLIGLDYRYSLQQKYGRFLYYLSPPSWRANNRDFARSVEIEAKGFDLGISSDEDTFTVIYEKLRKECSSKLVKPVLYFTEPKHLTDVFETIEKHQLNHFTHVTHFSPITKMLKDSIICLKGVIAQESAVITETITHFKRLVELSEQRSVFLKEKFFKILHGLFYESVGTLDVLKLSLHLDFCYEKVYKEIPMNKDFKTVAAALETFYMVYSKHLDALHSDTVRRAINICLQTERKKAKNAVNAAKELRLFYRLEKELLRAHGLYPKVASPVASIIKNNRKNKPRTKELTLKSE